MARGKGSERKQRHCGYNRPHQPHVYSGDKEREQGKAGARKYWCPGRAEATAEAAHKHLWEFGPVFKDNGPDAPGDLFNGPFGCSCGKSVWLKDGILTPLMEQLQKMGEMIVKMIQSFLDSLSPETVAYLAELGKSIGEKPDHVDTIELRDSMTGEVMSTELLTPAPISAVPATAIVADDEHLAVEYVSEPTTGTVPITTDLPSNVVHLQPGHALVGGKVIDLASLPVPRAQSFRNSSEH